MFPCPRMCLRIWSRETGSAVPSRVSLLILHSQADVHVACHCHLLLLRKKLNAAKRPEQSKGLGGNIGCKIIVSDYLRNKKHHQSLWEKKVQKKTCFFSF